MLIDIRENKLIEIFQDLVRAAGFYDFKGKPICSGNYKMYY
ncbi:MAG: hypothetical protein ABR596_05755 [Halarsenatibacteraceae bacterium]